MRIKEKIKIDDLFFGVVMYQMSYTSKEKQQLETYNLFDFNRVKRSVAIYVTMPPERKKKIENPLLFCFGDTWGRCEFEFVTCPWGGLNNDDKVTEVGKKVDIYRMYVEPNAELLMDLVSRVSLSSARAYLRELRKAYRR